MPSKEERDDSDQPLESHPEVIEEALDTALNREYSPEIHHATTPTGSPNTQDISHYRERPVKKPVGSIMLMDVHPDRSTVTSIKPIILALDDQAEEGRGSVESLDKRRKLEFSESSLAPDSAKQGETINKQKRRVSMAAPSSSPRRYRSRSASESSDAASWSPEGSGATSTHDRDRARQSQAVHSHVGSIMPRASKIFRRNLEDVPDVPDSMRGRTSIMSMHIHRRSLANRMSASDLLESAERRQETMVSKVREQMERLSWLNTPLKLDDDDDYYHDRWFGEIPGEWPSLTDMRRAWAMGWEYRAVYKGTWGPYDTAEGHGTLTRPLKVEYEGEFQDGMCHGSGAIHYPNGAVIRGTWERGRLLQPAYIASDGLNFDPDGPYCMMPDRRFYTEIQQGLRPAGRSQLTNAHPPRPVPPGCYDAGDGIFDPRRNCIYDPDTLEVVRVPTKDQMQWIKENCRKGWDENVGFRPELYENWWVESPPSSVSVAEEEGEEEEEEEVEEEERAGEEEEEEEGWAAPEEGSVRLEPTMEEQFDAEFEEEPLPAHMTDLYPPIAVQDVLLDATPAEDIYPFLFPESEEEGATVLEKLMVPVSTEVTQENLRMRQRYLNALEADRAAMEARELMEKKREEEEAAAAKAKEAAAKAKVESPPATPRLSLDETEEVYKGPWRHVARRLVPMLRQRLETDRKTAAKKWQDDLVRLLTERDTKAGLEMSTSGYLGAAKSVEDLSKPRKSRVIMPPGLEERARQRRAEREEREREAEEKRQAEAMAKQAAKEQGMRAAEAGSDSDEDADREPAPEPDSEPDDGDEEVPEIPKRRPSVLPSSAQATPKGGRVSMVPEDRGRSTKLSASTKKSLSFKPETDA